MYIMGPNDLVLNPARAYFNVLVTEIISLHPEVNFIFFKCRSRFILGMQYSLSVTGFIALLSMDVF